MRVHAQYSDSKFLSLDLISKSKRFLPFVPRFLLVTGMCTSAERSDLITYGSYCEKPPDSSGTIVPAGGLSN